MKRATRPLEMTVRLAWYVVKNRLRGRKRYPLVTMLEPLEMCNLACVGCGRNPGVQTGHRQDDAGG